MFLNKLEPDHHKFIVRSDIPARTMWISIYYLSTATPSLAMKQILPGTLKGSLEEGTNGRDHPYNLSTPKGAV